MDICLIMDVLEHLDDPESAVANAAEALRPGGHLLVTVPHDPTLWKTALFGGETNRLQAVLESKASPYRNGVSLLAVYRRREDVP